MFRKFSLGLAALALAAAAFAAFAPAASAQEGEGEREGDFLTRGPGVLHAEGDGLVAVKGRLQVDVEADRAILLVMDIAGDAEIEVEGEGGATRFHGFQVYFGTGEAHISGSHVAVIVLGNGIELDAEGRGWGYLKGEGTFTINGRGPFRWTLDGRFVAIVSDEEP